MNVPVPEEYVIPVMSYISELDLGRDLQDQAVQTRHTDPPRGLVPTAEVTEANDVSWTRGDLWPPERLRELAEGRTETTRNLTRVLDCLAKSPDEWLNLSDLADRTGVERDTLRYLWTQVSRHLKAHYGLWWPLDSGWGDRIPVDGQHIAYYRATSDQAAAWRTARNL